MMITIKRAAIVCLICVTVSSCGVMFGGSKYSASILVKDHPNSNIYVNGQKIGQGSAIGLYNRNQPLQVEVREEGCENKTLTYPNTFRGGNFFLSLISWGLVGIAVDLGTGASYKPDHKNNPSIERMTDKNYMFQVDYSECDQAVSKK